MIGEICWDPRAGTVVVELRGDAMVTDVTHELGQPTITRVVMPYADANALGAALAREEIGRLTNELNTIVAARATEEDVDTLRATIVRQANEITALKGESA